MIDLNGNTLMPSFIDGHGHISVAGEQYYTKVDLESAKTLSDIVFLLKKFIDENQISAGEPVAGFAYDHNYLEEGQHPDKKVLDQASAVHPSVISHTSGHVGVANSLALARAKVDNATEEIQGGVIERYPNTDKPGGYLEEAALMMVKQFNEPVVSNPIDIFAKVQELYAANGVTTAQDGASHGEGIKIMRRAGQQGKLYIDIVAYPIPFGLATEDEFNRMVDENKDIFGRYVDHVKISPCKSALDRGLIFNLHTDTPVRLPKMLHSVWAAVNRRTQNGVTIGPEQRIDVYNALKGITINAAYAYFEEDSKGSIKVGKRADLVILDRNPLKVDPMEIQDIQVLETIKDGTTIYRKE